MNVKRKIAIAGVSLLGVAGVGGAAASGVASAQDSKPKLQVTAPAPGPEVSAPEGAAEAPDATEAPGTAVEKAGVEPAGEASLPGGGHADTAGQNVNHQFEGVE